VILHTVACIVPQDTSFDQQVPHRPWDRRTLENYRTWIEKKGSDSQHSSNSQGPCDVNSTLAIQPMQCGHILTL